MWHQNRRFFVTHRKKLSIGRRSNWCVSRALLMVTRLPLTSNKWIFDHIWASNVSFYFGWERERERRSCVINCHRLKNFLIRSVLSGFCVLSSLLLFKFVNPIGRRWTNEWPYTSDPFCVVSVRLFLLQMTINNPVWICKLRQPTVFGVRYFYNSDFLYTL